MGNGSAVHQKSKSASKVHSDPSLVQLSSQFLSLRRRQDRLRNQVMREEGEKEPNWSLIMALKAESKRLKRSVCNMKAEMIGRLEESEACQVTKV